ncbi:hypothetical protein [Halegenticoccus soli]|uniref:hypothetical protein n=1 Tax=Halegenticoccus soli TaxID=1985678 RepID=UPI000C6EEE60|nr:hypothetical protein [Halegenticoccus soli]
MAFEPVETAPSDPETRSGVDRRLFMRGVAASAAVALPALAGRASAHACCRVCWVDVKPNCCPNAIVPDDEVILIAAGWPHFDPEKVKFIPTKGSVDAGFDGCQSFQNPRYDRDCRGIRELLAERDGRFARPESWAVLDMNGDGTPDTIFTVRVADLELEPDDAHLILAGHDAEGDCSVIGIDAVDVRTDG